MGIMFWVKFLQALEYSYRELLDKSQLISTSNDRRGWLQHVTLPTTPRYSRQLLFLTININVMFIHVKSTLYIKTPESLNSLYVAPVDA
jgi:hypothetical protein